MNKARKGGPNPIANAAGMVSKSIKRKNLSRGSLDRRVEKSACPWQVFATCCGLPASLVCHAIPPGAAAP